MSKRFYKNDREQSEPKIFHSEVCILNFVAHYRRGLELKLRQSGIPLLTPLRPKPQLQSLPPILGNQNLNPIPSCSKAPRGLIVLL